MARVICAKCDNDIKLGLDDDEGSEISCEKCSAKLKVVTDGEYLRTVSAEEAA
jgi:DNA-directed RNA polymerase subunit RPC12/RpoP